MHCIFIVNNYPGQVKGDGGPTCFTNIQDTGIPKLQEWCRSTLTAKSRQRSARHFLDQIRVFVTSVKSYTINSAEIGKEDKDALRVIWQTNYRTPGVGVTGKLILVRNH